MLEATGFFEDHWILSVMQFEDSSSHGAITPNSRVLVLSFYNGPPFACPTPSPEGSSRRFLGGKTLPR